MIWPEITLLLTLIKSSINSNNNFLSFTSNTFILYFILIFSTHTHIININTNYPHIQIWILGISILLLLTTNTNNTMNGILASLTLTSITITLTNNWINLYIILELQTIITLLIISFNPLNAQSNEAGLNYFTFSALSSVILLISITLTFQNINTSDINQSIQDIIQYQTSLIILIILFNLASSPFHIWLPDIYESTQNNFLIYLILIPNIALIVILIIINPHMNLILISGLLSTIVGAIGALNQNNINRLLAYSSINNTGIILLGIYTHSIQSIQALITHTIIYSTTTAIILNTLSNNNINNNLINEIFENDNTSSKENITTSFLLLSLSGLPPLPGFLSNWLIISSILNNNMLLTTAWILTSNTPAAVYYLYITINNYFNTIKHNIQYNIIDQGILEDITANNSNYTINYLIFPTTTLTTHPHTLLMITWTIAISLSNVPPCPKNPTN